MVPLHLVGGYTVLIFLKKGFLGVYVSGFGACRTLLDVSFIRLVVSVLSQLKHTVSLADNAPLPQPLRDVCSVV